MVLGAAMHFGKKEGDAGALEKLGGSSLAPKKKKPWR